MHTRKGSDNFDFFEYLHKRRERISSITDADGVRENHFPQMTLKGFSNMMSRLFNWLEEWLAIEEFKKQRYQEEVMLVKAYNRRGLYKLANSHAKILEKNISGDSQLDLENQKALSNLYHTQFYSDNPVKYQDITLYKKLIESYTNSIFERLKMYQVGMINWGNLKKIDFTAEIEFIKNTVPHCSQSETIHVFNKLINLIENQEVNCIKNIVETLKCKKIKINSELHTLLILYCVQYSIKGWMSEKIKDKNLIGEIYIYALNNKVFESDGKIPKVRFGNIISTLSLIKGYGWTNKLIDNYIKLVDCINYEDTLKLSKAQNCFQNERYDEIIHLINNIQGENIAQKNQISLLHIIGLFKSKKIDYEILNNKIHNYKRYLKRAKKTLTIKSYNSYFNSVSLIDQMSQAKFNNKEVDVGKYQDLIFRSWFNKEIKKHGK